MTVMIRLTVNRKMQVLRYALVNDLFASQLI